MRISLSKMGPATSKEWTCCFGLHVRTATIIIGMWHLFLNVLSLGILAAIIRDPAMMQELDGGFDDYTRVGFNEQDAPALPTPLSKIDPPYAYRDHSLAYHNVDMGGIVCMCFIVSTLMLIYGASKYKPSHLLPFFCLQLFDFAITTLTAAGYLCYLRSIHRIIDQTHKLPWREEFLKLSPQRLSIVVLLVFISVVLLKAYTIGIVWRCYKYLTIRQHNLRSMLPYIIPDISSRQERDYNTLLPDYEEAIAQSMKQPPPPYYQVVMSAIGENGQTATTVSRATLVQSEPNRSDANAEITPPAYNEHDVAGANAVTDNIETASASTPVERHTGTEIPKVTATNAAAVE